MRHQMRNQNLVDLNFNHLLRYGGEPPVRNAYDVPLQCFGYCVNCDKKGVPLDLMSHGCDTSDFEELLGPMPVEAGRVASERPIMFLLERPGGDYGNGEQV